MIVIHGENQVQSRQKLVEIIEQAQEKQVLVERLDANQLDLPTLEEKLQKTDLFGHARMLVVEGLHSLPKSKKQSRLIQMLLEAEIQVCLWEKRQLTPTMLKKLASAKVYEFKLANSLFAWLDSLSPQPNSKARQVKLLKTAVTDSGEYMCLIMLARQVRMLILAKTGGEIAGPFFVVNKVKQQAGQFELAQLITLHSQLYQLDLEQKTSTNLQELAGSLERVIVLL